MQATSDKTGSVGFTQTGHSINLRGIANNLTNGKTGYHTFYQWGRKDAFRSAEYTTAPAAGTSLIYSTAAVTVGETIKNPMTHYNSNTNSTGNSYSPVYYNAWNATYAALAGESTADIGGLNKTVKTVYDPCPVGYTSPAANTFTKFTESNCTRSGSCRQYTESGKTLYFPFTGFRQYNSATVTGHSSDGGSYSWVAVTASASSGRLFRAYSSNLYVAVTTRIAPSAGNRSSALPIRPVREK